MIVAPKGYVSEVEVRPGLVGVDVSTRLMVYDIVTGAN